MNQDVIALYIIIIIIIKLLVSYVEFYSSYKS